MIRRIALVTAALLILLVGRAYADATAFAPAPVVHAIWLSTQGIAAITAIAEPCTNDGLNDSVSRINSATENNDGLTLYSEEGGFAVGFAHCALGAGTPHDFERFAADMIQSGAASLNGGLMLGHPRADFQTKAGQYLTIANWLLRDPGVPQDAKITASMSMTRLVNVGLLKASAVATIPTHRNVAFKPPFNTPLLAIREAFEADVLAGGVTVVSMIEANDTIMAGVVIREGGSSVVLKRGADGWKVVGSAGGAIDARSATRYGLTPKDVKTFSGLAGGIVGVGQKTASTRPIPASVQVLISPNHPITLIQQAR